MITYRFYFSDRIGSEMNVSPFLLSLFSGSKKKIDSNETILNKVGNKTIGRINKCKHVILMKIISINISKLNYAVIILWYLI